MNHNKKTSSIFVIAICILLSIFGIYDQYKTIKEGKTFSEIFESSQEGME